MGWKKNLIIALIVAAVVIAAVLLPRALAGHRAIAQPQGSGGASVWPMFRCDPGNSGQASLDGPASAQVKWTSKKLANYAGSCDVSPVLGSDGTLYCSCNGALYAVGTDGKILRKSKFSARFLPGGDRGGAYSPVWMRDGSVVVATQYFVSDFPWSQYCPGRVYAFGPGGHLKWRYRDPEPSAVPSDLDDDPPLKRPERRHWGSNPTTHLLADGQHRIYVLTEAFIGKTRRLVVLDREGNTLRQLPVTTEAGSREWSPHEMALLEKGEEVWVYLPARNGLMIVGPDGQMVKVPVSDEAGMGEYVGSRGLCIGQDHKAVYALISGEKAGTLYKVDVTSHEVEFKAHLPGENISGPVVSEHGVYTVGVSPHARESKPGDWWVHDTHILHAVSHAGDVLWEVKLECDVRTAPAIDRSGNIYVTGRAVLTPGEECAIRAYSISPQGKVRWRLEIPSSYAAVSSPVIGRERTLYFYSDRAYCVSEVPGPGAATEPAK